MTNPLHNNITPLRLQQIYTSTAAFYDEVVAAHQAAAKETAITVLARKPNEHFLEVACGTAWALSRIVQRSGVERVTGLEFAPGMLDVARARLALEANVAHPPLLLADARHLPFADASFDCLLNTYTLEVLPLPDIEAVLRELHRVLRPAGRAVIVNLTEGTGPDAAFTDDWKQRYTLDPEYFSGARPLEATRYLQKAGFAVVQRHYSSADKGWPSEVLLAKHR